MAKSNEIKTRDWYNKQTTIPDYRYWRGQEWIDLRKQRNAGFNTRQPILNNTVYQATSSWLVTGVSVAGDAFSIIGYVWDTDNPSTIVAKWWVNAWVVVLAEIPISFPVMKWEYYKIDSTSWLSYWYFIPTY